MKHLKAFGLTAVAAMALMAIATSSASATALYTFNGTSHEMLAPSSIISISLKFGTKSAHRNTSETETLDECGSLSLRGRTENTGNAIETVKIQWEEVVAGSCTVPTSINKRGGFEIHWIPGTTNGTVTAYIEFGFTINSIFFGICQYGVSAGTHIGTVTGSTTGTAEFHFNSIFQKQTGSEAVCPSTSKWVASVVSTTPDHLFVEEK